MTKSIECQSCGSIYPEKDIKCPYCGTVNQPKKETTQQNQKSQEQSTPKPDFFESLKKDPEINIPLLIILAIVFWPAAIIYYLIKKDIL